MIIGIYSAYPFPQPIFGQTKRMLKILKYLSKSNKVIVFSPCVSEAETLSAASKVDTPKNIVVRNFDFPITYRYSFLNDINVNRFLRRERNSFDVLQLENSLGASLLLNRCKFPTVGVFQGAGLDELSWKLKNLLSQGRKTEYLGWSGFKYYELLCERTLARKSKRLIVTSQLVREYAERLGAHPTKIDVLRNGVDLEEYEEYSNSVSKHELRKKLGIPMDSFVFVFHGSFDFDQNIEAIKSILRIRKWLNNHGLIQFYFVIVGGPVEALDNSWRENLDNVLFTGYVKDVKPYLFAADCGLAPYPKRAVSGGRLKIVEFLAAGLPVIATKAGIYGFEELADNQPIFIINDLKDLGRLLPLPEIEVKKAKLKNFDWAYIASLNEKILKGVISDSS